MEEEMRRDQRVFLMGEEVAQYNGAYKVSEGMLDEFGPARIVDSPISETGFAGLGVGVEVGGIGVVAVDTAELAVPVAIRLTCCVKVSQPVAVVVDTVAGLGRSGVDGGIVVVAVADAYAG